MDGLTPLLLAAIVWQLWNIAKLLRRQTGMIQAASDLNLEAHQRLHEETWTVGRHLGKLTRGID